MFMPVRTKWVWGMFAAGFLISTFRIEGTETQEWQSVQLALSIPGSLAYVTDAFFPHDPSAPPDYILIQDVHRHPEVQAHIADLILHGYEQWGVRKVFLEGAFTTLDLSVFHRVPNKTRPLLLERLIRDGDISGPELAAVTVNEREWCDPPVSPFQLFGMEDPKLYRQNVRAYEVVIEKRSRALRADSPLTKARSMAESSGRIGRRVTSTSAMRATLASSAG